jgi:hypothetical protein
VQASPSVSITMPGVLTMSSLPCTMVRVDVQGARGDHRIAEVEGDPALSRAKRDTRRHQPASLPHVLAAELLDHEDVAGCGRARQVGGELGQLAERPG